MGKSKTDRRKELRVRDPMALPTPEEVIRDLTRAPAPKAPSRKVGTHDGNTRVVDSARVAQQSLVKPSTPPPPSAVPSNGDGKKDETRPLGPPPPWLTPEGRPRVAGTAIVPPTPPPKPDTSRLAGGSALRPKDADAVRNRAANGNGSAVGKPPAATSSGGSPMTDPAPSPAPAPAGAPAAEPAAVPAPVGTLIAPPPQPAVISTTPAPVVADPAAPSRGLAEAIVEEETTLASSAPAAAAIPEPAPAAPAAPPASIPTPQAPAAQVDWTIPGLIAAVGMAIGWIVYIW